MFKWECGVKLQSMLIRIQYPKRKEKVHRPYMAYLKYVTHIFYQELGKIHMAYSLVRTISTMQRGHMTKFMFYIFARSIGLLVLVLFLVFLTRSKFDTCPSFCGYIFSPLITKHMKISTHCCFAYHNQSNIVKIMNTLISLVI